MRLSWRGSEAVGCVESPGDIWQRMDGVPVPIRRSDEQMELAIALSYGVLIATLSNSKLTVTGDASVWPAEWGKLATRVKATSLRGIN